ncbi:CLUMA_CG017561, isoform A, partial [Clunio marinus]
MLDNFLSYYTLIGKIGEGSFSEVLKVKEKKSGHFYAAKRLTKYYANLDEVKACAELKTLQKLEYNQNVLSLVNFIFEERCGKLTLIFDLMDMSMYDFIKDRTKPLSERRCKNYIFQIFQGLHHLHRNGIFHRDIKPENILIRSETRWRNNMIGPDLIQIADLGSVCQTDNPFPRSAYISTRWYRAPECLLTSGYYGQKMDVWAVGCCFFEFLTLNPLFPGDNELDQLHKIHLILGSPSNIILNRFKHRNVNYNFPKCKSVGLHNLVPNLSDYGNDILKKTLSYHPDTRLSAKKILEHIYFIDLQYKKKRSSSSTSALLKSSSLTSTNSSNLGRKSIRKNSSSLTNSRGSESSNSSKYSIVVEKLHEA